MAQRTLMSDLINKPGPSHVVKKEKVITTKKDVKNKRSHAQTMMEAKAEDLGASSEQDDEEDSKSSTSSSLKLDDVKGDMKNGKSTDLKTLANSLHCQSDGDNGKQLSGEAPVIGSGEKVADDTVDKPMESEVNLEDRKENAKLEEQKPKSKDSKSERKLKEKKRRHYDKFGDMKKKEKTADKSGKEKETKREKDGDTTDENTRKKTDKSSDSDDSPCEKKKGKRSIDSDEEPIIKVNKIKNKEKEKESGDSSEPENKTEKGKHSSDELSSDDSVLESKSKRYKKKMKKAKKKATGKESDENSDSEDDYKNKHHKGKNKRKSKKKAARRNTEIYDGQNYCCSSATAGSVKLHEDFEVHVLKRHLDSLSKSKTASIFLRQMVDKIYTHEALEQATPGGFPARGKGKKYCKQIKTTPRLHPEGIEALMAKCTALELTENKHWRPKMTPGQMKAVLSNKICSFKRNEKSSDSS